MNKVLVGLTGVVVCISLCGCIPLLIGAGVAGGVAISRDTAKLDADAAFDKVWNATYKTIEGMGTIKVADKKTGKIDAQIFDSSVNVRLNSITMKTTRIKVKARKNLLPNVDLAVEIVNKIHDKL